MRKTRKERVLEVLKDGQWHDGYTLCHPGIGGSEGLRRLRELRAEGYYIEKRRKPRSQTMSNSAVFQYRLVEGPEQINLFEVES